MIKKLIQFIQNQKHYLSSDRYIAFLKSKGIKIGNNCIALYPRSISIDVSRPTLLEIGDNVFLHKGTTICQQIQRIYPLSWKSKNRE